MHVIVLGGSGFIGQAVCPTLADHGYHVTSISRSGDKYIDSNLKEHPYICWKQADVFDFSSWKMLLSPHSIVINLIGLLKEQPEENQTFICYHVDLQRALIPILHQAHVPYYLYLSAAGKSPWMSKDYLTTKQQAEKLIKQATFPTLIIQSGLVVDKSRPSSLFFGSSLSLLKHVPFIRHKIKNVLPITRENLSLLIVKSLNREVTGTIQTF